MGWPAFTRPRSFRKRLAPRSTLPPQTLPPPRAIMFSVASGGTDEAMSLVFGKFVYRLLQGQSVATGHTDGVIPVLSGSGVLVGIEEAIRGDLPLFPALTTN